MQAPGEFLPSNTVVISRLKPCVVSILAMSIATFSFKKKGAPVCTAGTSERPLFCLKDVCGVIGVAKAANFRAHKRAYIYRLLSLTNDMFSIVTLTERFRPSHQCAPTSSPSASEPTASQVALLAALPQILHI